MKITKHIYFSKDIEVDLTSDDIESVWMEDAGSIGVILSALNNVAVVLKGVPNERIQEMSDEQRHAVMSFLKEQADRYGNKRLS